MRTHCKSLSNSGSSQVRWLSIARVAHEAPSRFFMLAQWTTHLVVSRWFIWAAIYLWAARHPQVVLRSVAARDPGGHWRCRRHRRLPPTQIRELNAPRPRPRLQPPCPLKSCQSSQHWRHELKSCQSSQHQQRELKSGGRRSLDSCVDDVWDQRNKNIQRTNNSLRASHWSWTCLELRLSFPHLHIYF